VAKKIQVLRWQRFTIAARRSGVERCLLRGRHWARPLLGDIVVNAGAGRSVCGFSRLPLQVLAGPRAKAAILLACCRWRSSSAALLRRCVAQARSHQAVLCSGRQRALCKPRATVRGFRHAGGGGSLPVMGVAFLGAVAATTVSGRDGVLPRVRSATIAMRRAGLKPLSALSRASR